MVKLDRCPRVGSNRSTISTQTKREMDKAMLATRAMTAPANTAPELREITMAAANAGRKIGLSVIQHQTAGLLA
jgi:hypothetical protein